VFGELLERFNVRGYGSLRVISTLRFLQHHFAQMGHRDLLVTRPYQEERLSGGRTGARPFRALSR